MQRAWHTEYTARTWDRRQQHQLCVHTSYLSWAPRVTSGRNTTLRFVAASADFKASLKNVQCLGTSLKLFVLSSSCTVPKSVCTMSCWHFWGASRKTEYQNQNSYELWAGMDKYFLFHYYVHWNSVSLCYPKNSTGMGNATKGGRNLESEMNYFSQFWENKSLV